MPNVISGKNSTTGIYEEILSDAGRLQVDTVISGGATAAKQDTQIARAETANTALGNILTAVSSRYSFAETVWKDSATPPIYWIWRTYQDPTTFLPASTFTKSDGTTGTPTGALTPAATENTFTKTLDYDVLVAGTGYSVDDVVSSSVIRQTIGGAVIASFWYNNTAQAVIAPTDIDMAKLKRADELISVVATTRVCVSHQDITVPITTGVTLASLCVGGIIPVGAVTCEIQAQNGVVRYRLDASTVTPTTGAQIYVSETCPIDSVLASVRLVAETTAVTCSVKFFDKV